MSAEYPSSDERIRALRESLGIFPPPRPTTDFSDSILVTKVPCLGRLHFVRDRNGILMLSGIVVYWLYGMWSSCYLILMPHYQDGHLADVFIYYHVIIAFLCLLALFRASTLNPGRVPLVDESVAESQGWEVCPHCSRLRPCRAHHCSRCQQCVLKMDHHCPWINNCVGEANHHVFLLLLLYAFLFSCNTFVALMFHYWIWPKCQKCDHDSFREHYGIWFEYLSTVMSTMMGLFMFGQIIIHHFNIIQNKTTLEKMKEEQQSLINVDGIQSAYIGYSELFGTRIPLLWLLPCRRRRSKILTGMIHA